MVQQYEERMGRAYLDLAIDTRENLRRLLISGHRGEISLGTIDDGTSWHNYSLVDGELLHITTSRQHPFSKWGEPPHSYYTDTEPKTVTPDDVPLERYDIAELLKIATKIEEAQKLTPSSA